MSRPFFSSARWAQAAASCFELMSGSSGREETRAGRRARPASSSFPWDRLADEPGQEDQAHHRHQLDEDVERGTRGVLEGVTDGVADDGCFVGVRALAAVSAAFDVLLRVVPGAACVRHEDGHHDAADERASEESAEAQSRTSIANQLEIAWLLDEELVEIKGPTDKTGTPADVIGQDLRLPPGIIAVVEVVAGQDAGKVFRFTRGNVTVGRKMGEIPLSDPEVSRRHSVIEVFGREMIFLRDLGSTNGTFHNGRKVGVVRVRSGDTLGVGKTVMKLDVKR